MRQTVRFGPVYIGPARSDHVRGVLVRVHANAASCADERFPLPDPQAPTFVAGPGAVPRIDPLRPNALGSGLVGHEALELAEGPVRLEPVPVLIPDLRPTSDAPEILHPDEGAARLGGRGHDLFGDVVVHPGGIALLPSREPFQGALGAFRTFGLETGADSPPVLAVGQEITAGFLIRTARDGEIADPEVNPENPLFREVPDAPLDDDIGVEAVPSPDEGGAL